MRIPAVLACVVLVTLTAAGCGGESAQDTATARPSVSLSTGPTASATPDNGSSLDAADFAAAVKRSGTVLLDVRTPEEYSAGHLPGAVNIDLSANDFRSRVERLDPDATYGVYCHTGRRSAEAMAFMLDRGFTRVFHLSEGYEAWTKAGGETEKG